MSQCNEILEYIENHGSITSMEAFQEIGCTRLASRIHDLKRLGHNISSEMVSGKNRKKQTVQYKRYQIVAD